MKVQSMGRFAQIALPIVSLLMIGAAVALILENPRDFHVRQASGTVKSAVALASVTPTAAVPHPDPPAAPPDPPGNANPPPPPAGPDPGTASAAGAASTAGTASTAGSSTESVVSASGIISTPATTHPYFLKQVAAGSLEYGITRNHGIFVSTDAGQTWEERSNGLPLRVIYPFTNDPIAYLTSVGVDPLDARRVAVTTGSRIFLSEDAGMGWKEIPVHDPIKTADYFTSVALSPFDPATIAIGTSFAGIFVTTDSGKTWKSRTDSLGFIYRGAGFYEEVSGLAFSPTEAGVLYMGVGFGGGVYRLKTAGDPTTLAFPGEKESEVIRGLSFRSTQGSSGSSAWIMHIATDRKLWSYEPGAHAWKVDGTATPPPAPSPDKQARMARAANRTGIYLSPVDASGASLDHWIKFLKANGLNTLVVDVKDDRGRITYNSQVPFALKIGAVHPDFNMENLIRTAHENGIYVVGRFVVFKDPYLYRYDNHKYAIWDPTRGAPWGYFVKDEVNGKTEWVQKEFWVDPFSEFVWSYNISIAEELQRLGIDEIQFDYIRFPSEITSSDAEFRFQRPGMTRIDAIESFLVMARKALKIPISVDLFGYNSWYPISGWVAQNINVDSNYADVICPMFYPSLFPSDFLPQYPYLDRARYLYREGTRRSREIVDGRAIIRPFVQSFLLGSTELAMDKKEYSDYLRQELIGAQEANSSGFTLWNFGTDYYMVTFPLTPYVSRQQDALQSGAAAQDPASARP